VGATCDRERTIRSKNAEACPVVTAVEAVGTAWRVQVVYALSDGELRFNELKRATGARSKTLSDALDALQEHDLVERRTEPAAPIAVCPVGRPTGYRQSTPGVNIRRERSTAVPGTVDGSPVEMDPQEAFQLFSHELRLEILLSLWEAPDYSRTFTGLREDVGERDSGKFTYHLSKVEGQFVAQVDDRYVLQYAGHRVIDAIRSGVFHESPTVEPVAVDGHCVDCDGGLAFEYADHLATVRCRDCATKAIEYPFDPGGFHGRELEEAVAAFDTRTKWKWQLASSGVCFVCAGPVEVAFVRSAAEIEQLDRYDDYFAADHPAVLELGCRNCSFYSYLPVGVRLLGQPLVAGRLAERGVDLRERPLWRLPFFTDAGHVAVEREDPWRVFVEAPTPVGPIEVELDDDVRVASVTVRF